MWYFVLFLGRTFPNQYFLMSVRKKIKIRRTKTEFVIIDKKVKELGKTDLSSFLRGEIYKLEKKFYHSPDLITRGDGCKKMERVHYIDEDTYNVLHKISLRMRKPVSSIIDDFFITPLLLPDMEPVL